MPGKKRLNLHASYAAKNDICCLLDNGHYHPMEYVSDKIPSLLAFYDTVALHVTRGVRWDSDHVVLFEDELKEIAKEIVRNDATEKVKIGLDYFDASINRLSAWVTGQRAMQKALLPRQAQKIAGQRRVYRAYGNAGLPLGIVWNEYLKRDGLTESLSARNKDVRKANLKGAKITMKNILTCAVCKGNVRHHR